MIVCRNLFLGYFCYILWSCIVFPWPLYVWYCLFMVKQHINFLLKNKLGNLNVFVMESAAGFSPFESIHCDSLMLDWVTFWICHLRYLINSWPPSTYNYAIVEYRIAILIVSHKIDKNNFVEIPFILMNLRLSSFAFFSSHFKKPIYLKSHKRKLHYIHVLHLVNWVVLHFTTLYTHTAGGKDG